MRSLLTPSPRRLALGLFVALIAVFAVTKARSYETFDRPVTSSVPIVRPTTPFRAVRVGSARATCVAPIDVGPDADAAVVQVADVGGLAPGPALEVSVRAPGYTSRSTAPGGYGRRDLLVLPIRPARRALAGGRLCLRAVRGTATLVGGAVGRALSDETTTVGGRPAPVQLALALRDEPDRGLLARAGTLLDRAGFLRPAPLEGAWLWVLAALAALGVPVLAGLALTRAIAEDER